VAMPAGGSAAGRHRSAASRSIADRSMAENLNALSEARIEAAQFFEPAVEEALASRRGHLWYAASKRGCTTYTAFVTIRDRLARDAEPLLRMVRGIERTPQWIYSRAAPEIAQTISSFFPPLDRCVMAAAFDCHQVQSVWGHDPVLPRTALIVCGDASSRAGSYVGRRHTQPASTIASLGES
jgi:NitT/TauT family transport system substrate-binding protein